MKRSFYRAPLDSDSGFVNLRDAGNKALPVPSLTVVATAISGRLRAGEPVTLMRSPTFSESRVQPRRIKVLGLGSSKCQFTFSPLSSMTST
jgi:hypothetical protein